MYIQLTKNIASSLNNEENPSKRRCFSQTFYAPVQREKGNHSHAKKRVFKFVPIENRYKAYSYSKLKLYSITFSRFNDYYFSMLFTFLL